MNIYIFSKSEETIPNSADWLTKYQYNLMYYQTDAEANKLFSRKKPDVIISVAELDSHYPTLCKLPLYFRKRWVNVEYIDKITPDLIKVYFVGALQSRLRPTISVFTSTYKSGDKIMRPFDSLQKQTYSEWEWIIMDDSPTEEDNPSSGNNNSSLEEKKDISLPSGEEKKNTQSEEKKNTPKEDPEDTWNRIKALAEKDCRIRVFKQKSNDGFIGSVKHCTASMARGKYILELDHDDELLPTALYDVVTTFEDNPDIDMLGSDFTEPYEDSLNTHYYGEYFGKGRHGYYKERYGEGKEARWVNVVRNGPLDQYSINHIVGVYNHLRAWRYSTYTELRGHDPNLNVVDDYELIIRTVLYGRIARLPKFLYVQYRNRGGNNFTFIRLDLIQELVRIVSNMYDDKLRERFAELGLPYFEKGSVEKYGKPPSIFLNHIPNPTADLVLDPLPNRVTIVMAAYNQDEPLRRAVQSILEQEFKEWMLYIIGDKCPTLHQSMENSLFHDPRIRYWNMEVKRGEAEICRNYALKILASTRYITYLDPHKYWYPSHLSTLYKAIINKENGVKPSYAFSSFKSNSCTVICSQPVKGRIDHAGLIHKRSLLDKYGYWNSPSAVGFATNFELVSRWKSGGEIFVATKIPSLHYETEDMETIYKMHNDQE
jgi:glycosyltransferase involved in cell wall biosynthesis